MLIERKCTAINLIGAYNNNNNVVRMMGGRNAHPHPFVKMHMTDQTARLHKETHKTLNDIIIM